MKTLHSSRLRRMMDQVLQAKGMSEEHREYVIDGLIETSLRGIDTHGVRLFSTYLKELDSGRSKVKPNITFDSMLKAVANMDADNALGIVAGRVATKETIRLAKRYGVGAVSVRNSNHFGAASIYTLEMAKYQLVGLSFSHSDALVAPHNGQKPLFGTNPISMAAQAEQQELFCVDMATSQVSFSKVKEFQKKGLAIPEGWVVDKNGIDTALSQLPPVALKPAGLYKGQCLAMMVELLCALLTGCPLDHELSHLYEPPFDKPRRVGHFFLAFDIALFQNVSTFRNRLSTLMALTRAQQSVNGGFVVAPGDIEERIASERRENGIPLEDSEYEYFLRLELETAHISILDD